MENKKYVYLFKEGSAAMKSLLGGKGSNLAEMTGLGIRIPEGFTVTTEACTKYYEDGKVIAEEIIQEINKSMAILEEQTGKKFGGEKNPLLVSVRSGARASMPGMMDTVLNLGLNDDTVNALAESTGDERFALDCYRRFINMFGDVVMGVEHNKFERFLDRQKVKACVYFDNELTAGDWREVIEEYKWLIGKEAGHTFPQDPFEQLFMAINAVFNSWNNERAVVYRRINKIPDNLGTAINIQAMVFGNMGEDSGTGVAFTRDPSTGEKKLYGESLINAKGEDVVAGIRTPHRIAKLEQDMPEI